jgi:hypothetical protein
MNSEFNEPNGVKKVVSIKSKSKSKSDKQNLTVKDYTTDKIDKEIKIINSKIEKLSKEVNNRDDFLREKRDELNKLIDYSIKLNNLKPKIDSIML